MPPSTVDDIPRAPTRRRAGRPREVPNGRSVGVFLSADQLELFDALIERRGLKTRSALMRQVIEEALAAEPVGESAA